MCLVDPWLGLGLGLGGSSLGCDPVHVECTQAGTWQGPWCKPCGVTPHTLLLLPQSPAVVERAASLVREIAEGNDAAAKWVFLSSCAQ